jgi:ZIP family zinc transporter
MQNPRHAAQVRISGYGLALMLVIGLAWVAWANGGADLSTPTGKALTGGFVAALATAIGALPAIFVRRLSPRLEDMMLGFGAGVMAAASCFSLILPGLEAASTMFGARLLGAAWVAFGLVLGALFLLSADKIVPHAHAVAGHHGPDFVHLRRVWLMVFAIALHNFPEGMAIGVGFAGNDPSVGVPLAAAIAIQDIPEGLVVAIALRTVAFRPATAALIGAATGLVEPIGAILGNVPTAGFAALYPLGLGFAAGAMIWVVSHEIIPETHGKGHEQAATLGLIGGFVVMMMLDTALG